MSFKINQNTSSYRDIENLLSHLHFWASNGLSKNEKNLNTYGSQLKQAAELIDKIRQKNLPPLQLSRWEQTFAVCQSAYNSCLENPDTRPRQRPRVGLIQRIRSIEDLRPNIRSPEPHTPHHRAQSASAAIRLHQK